MMWKCVLVAEQEMIWIFGGVQLQFYSLKVF